MTRMYLLHAVNAIVCRDAMLKAKTLYPCNWQIKLSNGHFPAIRAPAEYGKQNTDVSKSDIAKEMM